jgi:hypothetical protein
MVLSSRKLSFTGTSWQSGNFIVIKTSLKGA